MRSRKMKRILILILSSVLLALSLVGCKGDSDDPAVGGIENYPEGAIPLTLDNFEDYFEIRVTTDLEVDYIEDYAGVHKMTKAESYVALVPKKDYTDVSGRVEFLLNAGISVGYSSVSQFKIAQGVQHILLGEGIRNASFRMTADSDYDYTVTHGSNTVTLKAVEGYVIEGSVARPSEYESLTDEERESSDEVLAELKAELDGFISGFPAVKSYTLNGKSYYDFKSLYGGGRDVSNISNMSLNPAMVDRESGSYIRGLYRYYTKGGELWEQHKNSWDLVEERLSPYSENELFSELGLSPDFSDLYDEGAVYVERDGKYYAYTTLQNMKEGVHKERITDYLENYGITTRWDRFIVKYHYELTEDSFVFCATVSYKDERYHVEYVDIVAQSGFEISDINSTAVEIFTPENSEFALEDSLEDAMERLTGIVNIDSDTEKVRFVVSQDSDREPPYNFEDNFLPIRINESGLYEFSLSDGAYFRILDAEGREVSGYYYPAGIYFLKYYDVPYGKTTVTLDVSVTRLDDYADMKNPIRIEGDSFELYLESGKDKAAFGFTPAVSGIYEFSDAGVNIQICAYRTDSLEDYESACSRPYLTLYLEGGVDYVFTFQHFPENMDESVDAEMRITHVGTPAQESPEITDEWREVFLGGGKFNCTFEALTAGYYVVEMERIAGVENDYISVLSDPDDYSTDAKRVTLPDGRAAFFLAPGRYYTSMSAMDNCYFKGRYRVRLEVETVDKEREADIVYDEYTECAAYLPTLESRVTFWITVTERCNLLYKGNGFFKLYSEDGALVRYKTSSFIDVFSGGASCYQWVELDVGRYYFVLESQNYSGASGNAYTDTRELRFQRTDEHEMQYYYMQAYPELKREEIKVVAYHGMYYGYRAALIEVTEPEGAPHSETVGGYEFRYASSNSIVVLKDGVALTLSEMYESWDESVMGDRDDAIKYFYERHLYFFPELYW